MDESGESLAGGLHVLRLTFRFPPRMGGLETHAFEISRQHALLGHRTTVVTGHGGMPVHSLVRVERVKVPPLRAIPSSSVASLLFGAQAVLRARRLGDKVDLVHAHGDAALSLAGAVLARGWRVPLVLSLHAGLSRRWWMRAFQRVAFAHPDRILAVSHGIREDVIRLGVAPGRIVVRSSGVDLRRFQTAHEIAPGTSPKARTIPIVVAVGRLHPMKGHTHLVRAARHLHDWGIPAQIVLIGGGPLERHLQSETSRASNVALLGARSAEEVAGLLQTADLFVLPSIRLPGQGEGTPTALLEAMAAGLPVVATDVSGAVPLLDAPAGGLVVPAGDPEALATAIARLLADPGTRVAMGSRNRGIAHGFDWSIVARDVLAVYSGLLKGGAGFEQRAS